MMYTILDIESNADGLNQRKGVLDSLEEGIKHNFYKNEEDATVYYSSRLSRKKELGGKYNEKFFIKTKDDLDQEETGEDEEE